MWQRLGRLLGGDDGSDDEEGETIHVFSLASGHLYERFMKIMMLSVVRRSSSPVKFWLVENFLSPEFKDAIPHLAEKCVAAAVVCVRAWGMGSRARNACACRFGFEVQMVTYKWPNWLRQQTEKQRIIWGYKILFLDTLFPLNLKKVIYVDADQVVRGDLTELWNMDLKGKPYGYTPFCTSREVCSGMLPATRSPPTLTVSRGIRAGNVGLPVLAIRLLEEPPPVRPPHRLRARVHSTLITPLPMVSSIAAAA